MTHGAEDAVIDRTAWIERRIEAGYDFAPLVRAMSQIVVHESDFGLGLDATAIMAHNPNAPAFTSLTPGPEPGMWTHAGTVEAAPLVDWLFTVALYALETQDDTNEGETGGRE